MPHAAVQQSTGGTDVSIITSVTGCDVARVRSSPIHVYASSVIFNTGSANSRRAGSSTRPTYLDHHGRAHGDRCFVWPRLRARAGGRAAVSGMSAACGGGMDTFGDVVPH